MPETFRVFHGAGCRRRLTRPRGLLIPPGSGSRCPPPSETRPAEPSAPTTPTPHQDPTQRRLPGPSERYGTRSTGPRPHKVGLRSSGTQIGQETFYICATGTTKIEDKGRQSADPEVLQELMAATGQLDPEYQSPFIHTSTTRLATSSCGTTGSHAPSEARQRRGHSDDLPPDHA